MENYEIDVNDLHFSLTDENGENIECDILYEAIDQDNKKVYIAYTDYKDDGNGKYRIIIAELINNDTSYSIIPIEDNDIENAIREQVNQLLKGEKTDNNN